MNPTNIDEPVSVILVSNADKQTVIPYKVMWRDREYKVTELATLPLPMSENGIIHHVFIVMCGETWMELALNTKTLQWRLLKINYQ